MPELHEPPFLELANAAMRKATLMAIRVAKQTGTPLIFWRDGKSCEVSPDDPFEEAERRRSDRGEI